MTFSFVRRRIDIAIRLAQQGGSNQPNKFAESGNDQVTLSGNRTSVRIQNSGSLSGSTANISVWGLSLSLMNQLSTLGMVIQQIQGNTITITAGDEGGSMTAVFVGNIMQAYADYGNAPKVPFRFVCQSGAAAAVIPYPASSFTGATDVATMLSAIARNSGWGFENSGVNVTLASPYYAGSAMTQVKEIEKAARINAQLINNVLCIWPRYGSRQNPSGIPLVSKDTGLIGYPSFTQNGILVKTLFDRRIIQGGMIKVQSEVFTQQNLERRQSPTSEWLVQKLDLAIDAEMPNGEWMSIAQGFNPRFPTTIPQQQVTP